MTYSRGAVEVTGGWALLADVRSPQTATEVLRLTGGQVPLIVADPPYGRVVKAAWDKVPGTPWGYADMMLRWTHLWGSQALLPGGAFYVFGGVGTPGFRPFFHYLTEVEWLRDNGELLFQIASVITWGKRRAYGVQHNYLFTREEIVYLCKGDTKRPRCFHIPLLSQKRGYAGYDEKYPAKSEYLRRTNVWTDVTEIFRGKTHEAAKPIDLVKIPVEVHTEPQEWVLDLFSGSGACSLAARAIGRRFVAIENDPDTFAKLLERLRA